MAVKPQDATILIVEDNLQNYVLITRLLGYLGVKKCEWKASGWQVLEFAETLPNIDLILMDIFLPEEDGYQVHERLRAHQRFKDTLIIAVTADLVRRGIVPMSRIDDAVRRILRAKIAIGLFERPRPAERRRRPRASPLRDPLPFR